MTPQRTSMKTPGSTKIATVLQVFPTHAPQIAEAFVRITKLLKDVTTPRSESHFESRV